MNLQPGDRVVYKSEDFAPEGGTFDRTEHYGSETRHYFFFDNDPEVASYVINFKKIRCAFTLTDHDLQAIG